jgi:mannose-6-phosphate isomerase-like protein (cupin superfamily)
LVGTCRACEADLPPDAKFCGDCGIELPLPDLEDLDTIVFDRKKGDDVHPQPISSRRETDQLPRSQVAAGQPCEPNPVALEPGWPDITNELAEARFFMLQGMEGDAEALFRNLARQFPGHPDLSDITMVPEPRAVAVRLVVVDAQGNADVHLRVEPDTWFEIGGDAAGPFAGDPDLEARHARVKAAPGGGLIVEAHHRRNGVFMLIRGRTDVRPGDQFRIGRSLAIYDDDHEYGRYGCITLLTGGAGKTLFPLAAKGAVIGREQGDIIIPDDTFVSGVHCRFVAEEGSVVVEDLQSSNGTYIRLRSGARVPAGAVLLLGQTQLHVRTV